MAADRIDLTVHVGEIVSVIGPNGSGKTTLFNMLTGLVRADNGSVVYHGTDITRAAPHEIAKLGIMRTFQNLRLFNNLSVIENVLIGQHARIKANTFASVLRTPAVQREEARAVAWSQDVIGLFGNRLLPRLEHVVIEPVLRQPAPRRDLARARRPTAPGVAGRARRGDEPGRDTRAHGPDPQPARPGCDRPVNRAQARAGDHHLGPRGRARLRQEDRRRLTQ